MRGGGSRTLYRLQWFGRGLDQTDVFSTGQSLPDGLGSGAGLTQLIQKRSGQREF